LIKIESKLNGYIQVPTEKKEKIEVVRLKKAPERFLELIRLVYSSTFPS
jgi:hypothetical protein